MTSRNQQPPGPRIRTDVVDVYVFRRVGHRVEFLQLRRAEDPLVGTWQPIMGHVNAGETAVACALRELGEEVGLPIAPAGAQGEPPARAAPLAVRGVWALDQVHPYFIARSDAIMLSPRFACEVEPGWEPRLNDEHEASRWIDTADVPWSFMWPGQMGAIDEILRCIVPADSLSRDHLRIV